ncbi:MAG: chromosome segregation protein SMC [Hyphomonadaceae bacterium]|nr:chromosome segregation protein SMC [Hyphomonadaceae bacterium]
MGSLRFNLLKLVGFKSFVEPTLFQIEPGLTGVVGPNGCGKSNLLEAIRWVMGANSAKAMRGAAMDDVIFNGTKSRPSRGQASVTITIDNSARIAPSMFNDDETLEITRTITKGSGSKYQVNGKTVRAKDIQLLFADASTGANSPALVRQGQINELISAKPSNRRRILEEAAGISGLHTRRHEAELRLRAAENNLDRLEDVLGQIESQLLSLRRQSRQATRYKRLAGEIREYKALLWLKRWEHALATLSKNAESLNENEKRVQELTGEVAKFSTEVAEISTKLEPHREEQIVAAAVYGRLNAAREALENDEQAAKGEIKKLEARLVFLKGDLEREEGIINDAENATTRLSQEFEGLKASKDMTGAVEQAQAAAAEAIEVRTRLENELGEITRKSAEQSAMKASAARDVEQLTDRKLKIQREIDSVRNALSNIAQGDGLAEAGTLFAASLSDCLDALGKARNVEQEALAAKAATEAQERELRDALTSTRQELSELQAEQKALTRMINSARGSSEWTPVLESVEVKKGYEAALTAAFGDDLEAGLDKDVPLRWNGADAPTASLPSGIKSLADFVKAPQALAARLSQIGLVEKSKGAAIAKSLAPGQRLVSVEGDLWRWDGFTASSDIQSAATIRLENINRLADIESLLVKRVEAAEGAEQKWQAAKERRETADREANEARRVLPVLEREEREARAAANRHETDQARQAEQISNLNDRLARLNVEIEDVNVRETTAQSHLSDAQGSDDLSERLSDTREKLSVAREAADEASGAYRGLKNEAEAKAARLAAVEQEIADWEGRSTHAKDRVGTLQGREAETRMALAAATDGPDEFDQRRQKLLSDLSEAEKRRQDAGDALAQIENTLKDAETKLRDGENALGRAREERAAAEARNTASQERIEEIQARINETLSCAPSELKGQLEELSPDSNLAEHDIERKLERLARERENMGAVNMRADAEAVEQEERLSALNTERQDLVAAIARLREGIDSLNSEGRERLLKAFDVVNGHFGRLFTTLFGGGSASLALTESDDPLEAGLEVMVSPPGKKLGSMSLMSGGEQALTATALIFAVFLSNPAPICVLDEVDAPLDDANVERYCDLLDEMCAQTETRFMVITHNPVTMARMNRLFGVTMAEKGVSQLVSIDLGEAEKITTAA